MKVIQIGETTARAREFVSALIYGTSDPKELAVPEGVGEWDAILSTIHQSAIMGWGNGGGSAEIAQRFAKKAFDSFAKRNPEISLLLKEPEKSAEKNVKKAPPLEPITFTDDTGVTRTINAYLDPEGGKAARAYVDAYIKWSETYAPRGHYLFHEGASVFVLSALAKRRIKIPIATGQHTGLFIGLAAESGKYTKTAVLRLVELALKDCGEGWLPWPKKMTPQVLFKFASGALFDKYDKFSQIKQEETNKQLLWCGQRPYIKDEFGGDLAAMANLNSNRRPFHDMALAWDGLMEHDDDYALSSGDKRVYNPYIPMFVTLTPENVKNVTGKGYSDLWQTGLIPRFVMLTPPKNGWSLAPFPDECTGLPNALRQRLVQFNRMLSPNGPPRNERVEVLNKKGEPTGEYVAQIGEFPECVTTIRKDAFDAFQRYSDHLTVMINTPEMNIPKELHPWYRRAQDKAIRVAALLAWMENGGVLELVHWIAAQNIVENWREAIHEFFEQLDGEVEITRERQQEINVLKKLNEGWFTLPELSNSCGLSTEQLKRLIAVLIEAGRMMKLEVYQPKRGKRMEEPFIYGVLETPLGERWENRIKKSEENNSEEKEAS